MDRDANEDVCFRKGVTWSDLTSGRFSARLSPGGFAFDVKGSSAFPADIPLALALLNSSFANYALNLVNPTVSYQVGDIARLPVPNHSGKSTQHLVEAAVSLARADSKEDETTYDFVAPPEWPNGDAAIVKRHAKLVALEQQVDEEVYKLYEISNEDRKAIEEELATPANTPDEGGEEEADAGEDNGGSDPPCSITSVGLAREWVSYGVGVALGRFFPGSSDALGHGELGSKVSERLKAMSDTGGIMVLEDGHPDDLAQRVLNILHVIYEDKGAEAIVRLATEDDGPLRQGLDDYLQGQFFKWHVKLYRKRPIYWLLQSPKKKYSVYLFHERATSDTLSRLQGKRYLGGKIHNAESELREAKQKETGASGRDKVIWSRRARDLAELLDDLRAFDQRITAANNVQIQDRDGRPVSVRWQPEPDDGVLLNASPLHDLAPAWKKADSKLDLDRAWQDLGSGKYDWAKTAMRYWPQRVLKACKQNKSFSIAHGLM